MYGGKYYVSLVGNLTLFSAVKELTFNKLGWIQNHFIFIVHGIFLSRNIYRNGILILTVRV